MQGVPRNKVALLLHDPQWDAEFVRVKGLLQALWGAAVLDVQHIGSTAIQGICAKPILDVAVMVRSFADMDVAALTALGYEPCGLQPPDFSRHLFVLRGGEERLSLQHIHVYQPNDLDFARCVGFCAYLNAHPEEARAYAALKQTLAARFPDDRIAYGDGKAAFIQAIYDKLP